MSLGISIYFGLENTFQENMDLLNDARELGYKKIFTSFHVPEADYNEIRKYLEKFFVQLWIMKWKLSVIFLQILFSYWV